MSNIASILARAVEVNPGAAFGTFQQNDTFGRVMERARAVAADLAAAGIRRGGIVALIGTNCASYLVTWIAAQQLGAQTALINPAYPDEFLDGMLDDLAPSAIVWIARIPADFAARNLLEIDATGAWDGSVAVLRGAAVAAAASDSGADCDEAEIAAYLHTSGTSGNPKFCALSHSYFARLGRYFADVMGLTRFDTLANPLPLFHINPIGNGVVGALTGCSGFLSTERFSVTEFWPQVIEHRVTAVVLHGPPSNMLKSKTTAEDSRGHSLRIGFFCDPPFLEQFAVPIGVGGYGSTEAGGYCHSWKFRAGDRDLPPEGPMHQSGQPRHDIECRLSEMDEILVRGKRPGVIFSGYAKRGKIDPSLDDDGWFHTGDRGRFDAEGNLVFIERSSESIRVNAEYVPIELVEERLRSVTSLGDFALWRIDSPSRGHEAVVYTTASAVDLDELRGAVADLPRYMHPTKIIQIANIPRDAGVGKTQRRLLGDQRVLATSSIA